MSLIDKLLLAVTQPQRVPQGTSEAKRESDRRIVSEHSNGNLRLQNGEYVTREELEAQYERVKTYGFD